ncbi:MAG: outer membrane protein assembly factor BamE [Magnetococcales bacterium]|nr:outer membrane protein assembly factor BamE [Magnetococcales bacterium]
MMNSNGIQNRGIMLRPFASIWLLILTLSLTACQAMTHEKGNILSLDAVQQIKIGQTTHRQVRQLLGSPTLVNSFRNERWIYIQDRQYRNYQRTFTRVYNRVELVFDASGRVAEINRNFGDALGDPEDVALIQDESKVSGWWNWLVGNPRPFPATISNNDPILRQHALLQARRSEQEPSLWDRLTSLDFLHSDKPDTEVAVEEEGWWHSLWHQNPDNRTDASTQPVSKDSSNSDAGLWWKNQ